MMVYDHFPYTKNMFVGLSDNSSCFILFFLVFSTFLGEIDGCDNPPKHLQTYAYLQYFTVPSFFAFFSYGFLWGYVEGGGPYFGRDTPSEIMEIVFGWVLMSGYVR